MVNRTIILFASASLSACGGGGGGSGTSDFDALRAEYIAIEDEIFPGPQTLPGNLPSGGGVYEGAASLAYFEDGATFTEGAAARVTLFVDFIEDDISGEITDVQLEGGTPVTGTILISEVDIIGSEFDTTVSGSLDIGGEPVAMNGTLDGAFYSPPAASGEGSHAYGNTAFDGGAGEPRFGGTFAAKR